MLGEFSVSCGEHVVTDQENRSRKVWMLLAYLIQFRNREIPQSELIDLLWAEEDDSNNPANALKTVLHRVRSILNRLEVVDGHQLILRRPDGYCWNIDLPCSVDVDEFEAVCQQGRASADFNIRLACFRRAASLYKGDFLPKLAGDHWVMVLNTYYRRMYSEMIHELLAMLVQAGENQEIISVAANAIRIDPYDESFYYYQIKALVDSGNQRSAMAEYEKMNELFFSKFGVTPSDELKALYRQIVKSSNAMEIDLGVIKEHLRESSLTDGAFYCEYEFFKDVYRIEARSASRTGSTIHLGLVTMSDLNGEQLSQRKLNLNMGKLQDLIQSSLRRGDVYAKYSVSQFIIMLPYANYENSCMVLERIIKRFQRENSHSPAVLRYSVQPLEPVG